MKLMQFKGSADKRLNYAHKLLLQSWSWLDLLLSVI